MMCPTIMKGFTNAEARVEWSEETIYCESHEWECVCADTTDTRFSDVDLLINPNETAVVACALCDLGTESENIETIY